MLRYILSCSHKFNVARSETFCCQKGVLIITCFVLIPFPHAVSFLFVRIAIPCFKVDWMDKILKPKKYLLMSDMVCEMSYVKCLYTNFKIRKNKKLIWWTISCKSRLPSYWETNPTMQSFFTVFVLRLA